jgi:hypothetical protein
MYSTKSGLILGFHGTDEKIVEDVVNGKSELKFEPNKYDWLGNGNYFWESDPERAFDYAKSLKKYPERSNVKVETPAVLGAVMDLGKCLDLITLDGLRLLKSSHDILKELFIKKGLTMPQNKRVKGGEDLLLRELDCLVIEKLHERLGKKVFDSVRGVFWEGELLYDTAGFREKNHIQICIRNPNCIKGFFLPREITKGYSLV